MHRSCRLLAIWLSGVTALSAGAAGPVRVFILAGQSNAVGAGADGDEVPVGVALPEPAILFNYEIGPVYSKNAPQLRERSVGGWIALDVQPDGPSDTFDYPAGFGPEVGAGLALAETGQIALLKFAFNGSSLVWDWHPELSDSFYGQLVDKVSEVSASLVQSGYEPELAGLFWMQGEADAAIHGAEQVYATNLALFIESLRADLGEPRLPVVLGRIAADIWQSPYGITPVTLSEVRAKQIYVADVESDVQWVDTDDLPLAADWIHFTAAGEWELGLRFAAAWQAIVQAQSGDLDGDGHVNGNDAQIIRGCLTGDSLVPEPGCEPADLDGDGDADLDDFGLLQQCLGE